MIRRIRNVSFVAMSLSFLLLISAAPTQADEGTLCTKFGYTCSENCGGLSCDEICESCGEGYVPAPGAPGHGFCGISGAGNCDFQCGLEGDCWSLACKCRPPIE